MRVTSHAQPRYRGCTLQPLARSFPAPSTMAAGGGESRASGSAGSRSSAGGEPVSSGGGIQSVIPIWAPLLQTSRSRSTEPSNGGRSVICSVWSSLVSLIVFLSKPFKNFNPKEDRFFSFYVYFSYLYCAIALALIPLYSLGILRIHGDAITRSLAISTISSIISIYSNGSYKKTPLATYLPLSHSLFFLID